MGSFSRKSEFRKAENLDKPITKGEKFNVDELSLLRNNYAHVILTAEADSLPTDEKKLLEDYGLVGYSSSRGSDLSVHTKNWFHRVCSPPVGIKCRRRHETGVQRFLK